MGEGPSAPLTLSARAVTSDQRRAPAKEYVEVGAAHQAAGELPPDGEPAASRNHDMSSQRVTTLTAQKFEPNTYMSASQQRGTLRLESDPQGSPGSIGKAHVDSLMFQSFPNSLAAPQQPRGRAETFDIRVADSPTKAGPE